MSMIGVDSMKKKKKDRDQDQMKEDIIKIIKEEKDQIKKKGITKQKERKYLMMRIINIDQRNMIAIENIIERKQENIDRDLETDIISDNQFINLH